jgi:hypothetical protein
MQSVAVMLLDLAYKAKSEKTDNSETILALKKLMEWLHAMHNNDPVAGRAYQIVRKIIQTSGPAFQEITRVLLTKDTKPSPGTQSSSRNDSHNDRMYEFRQGDAWPQEEALATAAENPGAFDLQYYPQLVNSVSPEFSEAQYFWSTQDQFNFPSTFGNPFINSFDQGAPVINMADLWANPGPSTSMGDMTLLDTDPTGVVLPTDPPSDPFFFQPPPGPSL